MNKIIPVAIAVIHDKKTGGFLLTQRKGTDHEDREFANCWNFPGGGIHFGEDPLDALKREIKEELGVEIDILVLLPKIFSPVRNKWHGLLICYLCTLKNPKAIISLNDESVRFGWFTVKQIQSLKTLPLGAEIASEAVHLINSTSDMK